MNQDPEHIDEFERLARYFAGESSPEEIEWVESWKTESDQNRLTFEGLAEVWVVSDTSSVSSVDSDAAWEKVKFSAGLSGENGHSETSEDATPSEEEEGKVIPFTPSEPEKINWKRVLSYAAILILPMIGFVYLMFFSASKHDMVTFATKDQPQSVTLPDGTVVTLNEKSSLEYPESFDGDRRDVNLEGEAFFEVVSDTAHPFYVHIGPAEVKVLGTSFNVKAKKRKVTVSVESGKVRFAGRIDAGKIGTVRLEAGQTATYQADIEEMEVKQEQSENVAFYKTRELRYQDTRLETVLEEVSDFYPGKVKVKNAALNDCRLDATYRDKSIGEVVELIAATFNLEVTQNGKTYYLEGESCE